MGAESGVEREFGPFWGAGAGAHVVVDADAAGLSGGGGLCGPQQAVEQVVEQRRALGAQHPHLPETTSDPLRPPPLPASHPTQSLRQPGPRNAFGRRTAPAPNGPFLGCPLRFDVYSPNSRRIDRMGAGDCPVDTPRPTPAPPSSSGARMCQPMWAWARGTWRNRPVARRRRGQCGSKVGAGGSSEAGAGK